MSKVHSPAITALPTPKETASPVVARIGPKVRERRVKYTLYIDEPVYDVLREIGHERKIKLQPLLQQAVSDWLKRQGHPGWATLANSWRQQVGLPPLDEDEHG